jgi:hypothetical protein
VPRFLVVYPVSNGMLDMKVCLSCSEDHVSDCFLPHLLPVCIWWSFCSWPLVGRAAFVVVVSGPRHFGDGDAICGGNIQNCYGMKVHAAYILCKQGVAGLSVLREEVLQEFVISSLFL